MKKINKILFAGLVATMMSSCSVTVPVAVSNAEIGSLRGTSKSTVILGVIYMNKQYGIKEAARNGGITSAIATVDEKTKNMIFFSKKTLIVTAK